MQYGFYSKLAEDKGCKVEVWTTNDGKEVRVTAVEIDQDGHGHQWTDRVSLGPVVRWVKDAVPATWYTR